MNTLAHRVEPNPDGFAPVLQPGQYCQDGIDGVWHFRAPDGARFAAGGELSEVKELLVGVRFLPKAPEFVRFCDRVIPNPWTIQNGEWVNVTEAAA